MTNAKNVYVLLLSLIIVLSGCFGNTAPDVDGQQETGSVSNVSPLIEIGGWSTETGDYNATHWNASIYRAMTDIDGVIVSAGWDFDLDGTIDYPSTNVRSIDNLSIPASNWLAYSTINGSPSTVKFTTISFIAIDDDGYSSGQLITIDTATHPYWPGSTNNMYTAEDAAADTTDGSDDTLISMRWQHAEDDLNWANVVIKLSVGDNTYDCAPDASQECTIGQDGDDDSVWEAGEFLILSESGSDIAGASGATSIDIYVTYGGSVVAGDSSVTVS